MRRTGGRKQHYQPKEFWQSYSDMMAVLLLVFAMVLTGSILQARSELDRQQDELTTLENALVDKIAEYEAESEELNEKEGLLDEQGTALDAERSLNATLKKDLNAANATIADLTAKLKTQEDAFNSTSASLDAANTALDSAQASVANLQGQLNAANTAIAEKQGLLDTANATIAEKQGLLDTANAALSTSQASVADLQGKLDTANAAITEKQGLLDAANTALSTSQASVADLQGQLDTANASAAEKSAALEEIVGVRKSLIEQLKTEFAGQNLMVNPQTGSITLDSDLLFNKNQSILQEAGKQFLDDFFPRYVDVLLSGSFAEYVSEIIIEGHADTDGTYLFNLQLSQNRALAVAAYCIDDNRTMFTPERRDELRKIVTANGRSWSNPILNPDGTVNMEKSRRVEIQFRLKDEDMITRMAQVLGE